MFLNATLNEKQSNTVHQSMRVRTTIEQYKKEICGQQSNIKLRGHKPKFFV